jgi:hypothetical protein
MAAIQTGKVSREQAEVLLAAVRERHAAYIETGPDDGPHLRETDPESAADWEIVWEDGPYEWALGDLLDPAEADEELSNAVQDIAPGQVILRPKLAEQTIAALQSSGLFWEPGYSFTLLIYPAA